MTATDRISATFTRPIPGAMFVLNGSDMHEYVGVAKGGCLNIKDGVWRKLAAGEKPDIIACDAVSLGQHLVLSVPRRDIDFEIGDLACILDLRMGGDRFRVVEAHVELCCRRRWNLRCERVAV